MITLYGCYFGLGNSSSVLYKISTYGGEAENVTDFTEHTETIIKCLEGLELLINLES